MLEVKEVLVGDMSVKQSLSGEINNRVEVIYPSLIDIEVTPSKEVQTFKHEGSYGYDNVVVKAIPEIELESKVVTPTKSIQTVEAEKGYDGLSQVIVNPIPSEYIVPSGELEITENGIYDVSNVTSANVDVPIGGGVTPSIGFTVDEWNSEGYATKISTYGITTIPKYAFYVYNTTYLTMFSKYLETVTFNDELTIIDTSAFCYNSNLNISSLPKSITTIGKYAFEYCNNSNLTIFDFTNDGISGIRKIDNYAFNNNKMPKVSFINNNTGTTNILYVNDYAFRGNTNLTELYIEGNVYLQYSPFTGCTNLKKIHLKPNANNSITFYSASFNNFANLDTIIIEGTYNQSAITITNTPIANGTGFIYVDDSKVDYYKSASGWSTYASQIKPISELK